MARALVAASSQYLKTSDVPINAYPFTLGTWFKATSSTSASSRCLIGLGRAADSVHNIIFAVTTSGKLILQTQSGGSGILILGTDVITAGRWYFASISAVSSATINMALNTLTYAGTGTGFPGVTDLAVGAIDVAGFGQFFDGSLAEVGIWNVALSAAEIAAMSLGAPVAMMRRQNLQTYWPLWGISSPEADLSGRADPLTLVNAPTPANHAPVGRYAPFPNPYSRAATFVNASGLYVPQRTLRGVGT